MRQDLNDMTAKLVKIEHQHNVQLRCLNKFDVIVSGLRADMKNVTELVLKIAERCKIKATYADLQYCCYLANGNKFSIRCSSIYVRYAVMLGYATDPSIKFSYITLATPVRLAI